MDVLHSKHKAITERLTHLTADSFLHGDELCGVFLLQDDAVLVVSARVGDVNLQAVEYGVTCNNDSIVKISYFLAEHKLLSFLICEVVKLGTYDTVTADYFRSVA